MGRKVIRSQRRPEINQLTFAVGRLSQTLPAKSDIYGQMGCHLDVVLAKAIHAAHMEFPGRITTQVIRNVYVA